MDQPQDFDMTPHLPHVDRSWTIGTVLAASASFISLLGCLGTVWWFAAEVSIATRSIPDIKKQLDTNTQAILVLQDQQHYTDLRYEEIKVQLIRINDKLDVARSRR